MKQLIFALFSEGSTDERFLPNIIQRTTAKLLPDFDVQITNLELKEISNKNLHKLAELILLAAQAAYGSHVLLIHTDADRLDYEAAYKQRFQPGYIRVQEAKQKLGADLCEYLVPVIPVRMTEAWMLADVDKLIETIGTDKNAQALGLPLNVAEIEKNADPKRTVNEAIRIAHADETRRVRRGHKRDIGDYYLLLGIQIKLEKLEQLPSYQKFVESLTETLRTLNFIR